MANQKTSIFYIDLLRCIAAFAVIIIHVLGPLRGLYGEVPTSEWFAAASFNSFTRWAVPVFMMISGALLLSNDRPFDCKHYLSKRLGKVVIPFIAWTLIYAVIAGISFSQGQFTWSYEISSNLIDGANNTPTWYHLWFFYDFIPLYFIIPFLAPLLKKIPTQLVYLLIFTYMVLFLTHWLKVESILHQNIIFYTGYLIIGWYLFNRDNTAHLRYWVGAGVLMLILNALGTLIFTQSLGKYSSLFMGYKTLNTMIIGGMLFVVAQCYADKIKGKFKALVLLISKYSLGIYLCHPIFLIPVRDLSNGYFDFFGSYWVAIPSLTIIIMAISILFTYILAKIPILNRIAP